jgi:DNA-binding transcriptional LysR family regulator
MDRFRVIESFVRVAQTGSFTKAARQLGLSRALISRRIIELEARLGVRLVNRSTRSVSLTTEGQAYLNRCKQILDDMEAAEREIARGANAPRGAIRLLAPKSFGATCLSEAMIEFSTRHPQIGVSLSLGDFSFRPADFVEEGFDVAIRIGDIRDSNVLARRITTLTSILCANPNFIAGAGLPQNISDLTHYCCLSHLGVDEHDHIWSFVGQRGGSVRVNGSFDSNSALVLRKAALAGLGIALLPEEYIADDLAAGTLIRVLPEFDVKRPVIALYAQSPPVPEKVRVLVSFLVRWFNHGPADRPAHADPDFDQQDFDQPSPVRLRKPAAGR